MFNTEGLGLSLSQVLLVIPRPTDEGKGVNLVELFVQKSSKFRCASSGRLMASPVLAPNGQMYEQSSLSSANLEFSEERLYAVPYLKDEIQAFSKASLQKQDFNSDCISEDDLTIAAECLSVLNVNAELESFLRVLTPLSKENLEFTLGKLRNAVPEEELLGLLTQLADREDLQLTSLILLKKLVQQPLHDFDAVCSCFFRVLSQSTLNSEVLGLVEELKTRLTAEQLIQVIEALSSHGRDQPTQLKIDELKLNVAYLKKEDKATALSMVESLYSKPEMKEKLEAFFEATGWIDEFPQYYKANFMRCLGGLGDPNVAEGLWSLFQFFSHKLENSTRSQRHTCSSELEDAKREINQALNEQGQLLIGHQTELESFGTEIRQQLGNEVTIRSEHAQVLAELAQSTSEINKTLTASQQQEKADTSLSKASLDALTNQFQLLDEKIQLQLNEVHQAHGQLTANLVHTNESLRTLDSQVQAEIGLIRQTLEELGEYCQKNEQRLERLLEHNQEFQRETSQTLAELRSNIPNPSAPPEESKQSFIELPSHTYSYQFNTGDLHIEDFKTGESTVRTIPSFQFKPFSSWCSLPSGSLFFTGGTNSREVVTINPISCSVATKPPMSIARWSHGSAYYKRYVFIIGGHSFLRTCEKYSVSKNRWAALPPLPTAVQDCGVVTQEATQSLYVLGGKDSNLIQELNLARLEWQTLEIKLPSTISNSLAVFKVSEQECFFVLQRKLYAFSPSVPELRLVKPLSAHIQSARGSNYYSNGTLYCANDEGAVKQSVIGSLR